MTINLNTYANVVSPDITTTITSSAWLNLIKESTYLDKITEARIYKKTYLKTENKIFKDEYEKIKRSLPAVSFNGLFTDRKNNNNFVSGTGLIYIDVDDLGVATFE